MTIEFPANWLIAQDYDPKDHLMNLKGKDYLNVQNRLIWFIRDQRALIAQGLAKQSYSVQTELVELNYEGGWAVFKTTARDVLGNEYADFGSESKSDFADYIEKAATKSKGRALAGLGYGTQFAPELDEGERIVDAPVERRVTKASQPVVQPSPQPVSQPKSTPAAKPAPQPAAHAEAPVEKRGMTPEQRAKWTELKGQYADNEFLTHAVQEAGWDPTVVDPKTGKPLPIQDTFTQEQIQRLFSSLPRLWAEWLVAKHVKPAEKPAEVEETVEEVVEQPVAETAVEQPVAETVVDEEEPVDEQARSMELRQTLRGYVTKEDGKVDMTLFLAAMSFILPRVPVSGRAPLSIEDLQVDGKTTSEVALMVRAGIPLKVYNDLLDNLLNPQTEADEELNTEFVDMLAQAEEQARKRRKVAA